MRRHFRDILLVCLFSITLQAQSDYKILNFDKQLIGTDKLIYLQPPEGKYWMVLQGSTSIERPVEATFVLWLENAPYAPYRDPVTGEMKGCERCVTIEREDAANRTFFPIRGETMPILVSWPNRMMIAVTPVHGGLDAPLMTWTRLQVIEHDLPPTP